jgi:hypothetical protein
MAQDTHRIRWKVLHGAAEGTEADERDFGSLTEALLFIRDESAAADGGYARLVSDELSVASFRSGEDGVTIGDDAIALVEAAWGTLDDD